MKVCLCLFYGLLFNLVIEEVVDLVVGFGEVVVKVVVCVLNFFDMLII